MEGLCERSERATEIRKTASGWKFKIFWIWEDSSVVRQFANSPCFADLRYIRGKIKGGF